MMAHDKLLNIANKLLERSRLGEVNWRTSEAENTYLVTYSRSSFLIWSDEVAPRYFRISAMGEDGVVVDSMELQDEDDIGYEPVSTLYDLASRQAKGTDEVLDNLLQEIEGRSV